MGSAPTTEELLMVSPSLPAAAVAANDVNFTTEDAGGDGVATAVTPAAAAFVIPTGIGLYILSLATLVGNAMVLHAIRTEKRLQTVRHSKSYVKK